MTVLEVGELIDAVLSVATLVMLDFLWRPVLADADDDMVLETAVNGSADWLVTFNRRDFALAVRQFAVIVCSPGEAVGMLEMDG